MSDALRKFSYGATLRAAPAAQIIVAETLLPLSVRGYERALVVIRQTAALDLPNGADVLDFYLETSYDGPAHIFNDSTANTAEAVDGGDLANMPPNVVDTIDTTDGTQFEVGDTIRIGTERMLVTGIAVNVLTVRRGQDGTSVDAHANATDIFLMQETWTSLGNVHYATGDDTNSPAATLVLGSDDLAPATLNDVIADVADDTVRALPLSEKLRLRVAVTLAGGSGYNYEAFVNLYGG